jgi:hypothetical protein
MLRRRVSISGGFNGITSAQDPRIGQLALNVYFSLYGLEYYTQKNV